MKAKLDALPDEILYIPKFVCVVGSSVHGEGNDVDVLIRGDAVKDEGMIPLLRKAFRQQLHYIFNPAGAHDDYIPVYDLVLMKRKPEIQNPRESLYERLTGAKFNFDLIELPEDIKLDIGCGRNKKEGYIGLDRILYPGVDIVIDLSYESIPFPESTVSEIRAHHILEHLTTGAAVSLIADAWRCLKPNGKLDIEVPSTDGRGAFMPAHLSYWNEDSFAFFANDELREQLNVNCRYRILEKTTRREDEYAYAHVVMEAVK